MRAVPDHQPPTLLVDQVGMRAGVGSDLDLKGYRQHLPGAVPDQLIQQRAANSHRVAS